ncbi:hypothetical protein BOX15_Mlig028214g1 [Macrostomum lignano]|uniref:Secreted protein n=2 Tax=Macrostomum lignano TaxID=282301 RepID=A0A267DZJ7_9PLAT|nr:hypothetical protein BOX15_Mlig029431g3 [Macrostomum lignano]PAA83238.1 hypothetical protein BOX15_Mlig028214g1 [Macrostomum lignano]
MAKALLKSPVSAAAVALLLSLQVAFEVDAAFSRRCFVTRLDQASGVLRDSLERCDADKPFCFRGRLTRLGESAVKQLYNWPVRAGRVMRGCVQSRQPPDESVRRWYEPRGLAVCVHDGCNN